MNNTILGTTDADWTVIEHHTTAIGVLTIYTAMLDSCLGRFMERLLGCDEQTTACITTALRDISKKTETIRRLVQLKSPNSSWGKCTLSIMNLIQNEICPRRNRYIHDDWDIVESEMIRHHRTVKFVKPSAGEPPVFVHVTSKTSNVEDIHTLIDVVLDCVRHVTLMSLQYASHATKQTPLEPSPQAILLSNYTFQDSHQQVG